MCGRISLLSGDSIGVFFFHGFQQALGTHDTMDGMGGKVFVFFFLHLFFFVLVGMTMTKRGYSMGPQSKLAHNKKKVEIGGKTWERSKKACVDFGEMRSGMLGCLVFFFFVDGEAVTQKKIWLRRNPFFSSPSSPFLGGSLPHTQNKNKNKHHLPGWQIPGHPTPVINQHL